MKFVCVTACARGLCWNLPASETNLLSFDSSSDEAALAERPDPYGRALNDGDWDTGGAVRFDKDVTVTIDLFVPTYIEYVRVHTVTSGTCRTASVSLEGRMDGASWQRLGASTEDDAQVFTAAPLLSRVRYLRVARQKDAAAAHQDVAEIAVTGRQQVQPVKQSFSYTPSLFSGFGVIRFTDGTLIRVQ